MHAKAHRTLSDAQVYWSHQSRRSSEPWNLAFVRRPFRNGFSNTFCCIMLTWLVFPSLSIRNWTLGLHNLYTASHATKSDEKGLSYYC